MFLIRCHSSSEELSARRCGRSQHYFSRIPKSYPTVRNRTHACRSAGVLLNRTLLALLFPRVRPVLRSFPHHWEMQEKANFFPARIAKKNVDFPSLSFYTEKQSEAFWRFRSDAFPNQPSSPSNNDPCVIVPIAPIWTVLPGETREFKSELENFSSFDPATEAKR